MRQRWNGSMQSSNTPTWDKTGILKEDYNQYRCMVIKVIYADDPQNITKNSQNPEVLYDVVILGGFNTGQILSNARVSSGLGGNSNYSERTLTSTSKDISKTRLSEQDGDIVLVEFIQGHDGYPFIVGTAKGPHNRIAATRALGPRSIEEYNGLVTEINNFGEYTVTRKGGSVASNHQFVPGSSEESSISLKRDETIELKNKSTGKLKIKGAKVALGASGVELLQKISEQLQALITWANTVGAVHTHIGNLGYPTAPPTQAAGYTQLGTDLNTIKSAIDGIKGSL